MAGQVTLMRCLRERAASSAGVLLQQAACQPVPGGSRGLSGVIAPIRRQDLPPDPHEVHSARAGGGNDGRVSAALTDPEGDCRRVYWSAPPITGARATTSSRPPRDAAVCEGFTTSSASCKVTSLSASAWTGRTSPDSTRLGSMPAEPVRYSPISAARRAPSVCSASGGSGYSSTSRPYTAS